MLELNYTWLKMLFENYISRELFVSMWKFYKRDENVHRLWRTRVNDGCNVLPKNSKHINSERSVFQTLVPPHWELLVQLVSVDTISLNVRSVLHSNQMDFKYQTESIFKQHKCVHKCVNKSIFKNE